MKTTTFSFIFLALLVNTWLPAQEGTRIEFGDKEIQLSVNDSITLEVKLITDSSVVNITDLTFTVLPDSLGKVENHTFYALKSGNGWIKAVFESYSDSIRVSIEQPEDTTDNGDNQDNDTTHLDGDTTKLNVVYISRVLPSGMVLPAQIVNEGQKYVIGGLPRPMNILNGGEIFFPVGSLKEDITIHIELPKFAEINKEDSVLFKNKKVLASVSFHVYVKDSLVSPYYFELPLEVAIPFKRGLIKTLGLDPTRLSLFYASDSLELDQDGISGVVVDSVANLIKSQVAHFSNLVVAENSGVSSINSLKVQLMNMFPNPTSNMLNIRFNEKLEGIITVSMYNLMGQKCINQQINTAEFQLDISDFPVGMYVVKVTNEFDDVIYSGPIIKK